MSYREGDELYDEEQASEQIPQAKPKKPRKPLSPEVIAQRRKNLIKARRAKLDKQRKEKEEREYRVQADSDSDSDDEGSDEEYVIRPKKKKEIKKHKKQGGADPELRQIVMMLAKQQMKAQKAIRKVKRIRPAPTPAPVNVYTAAPPKQNEQADRLENDLLKYCKV